jgi:hypothetical protein
MMKLYIKLYGSEYFKKNFEQLIFEIYDNDYDLEIDLDVLSKKYKENKDVIYRNNINSLKKIIQDILNIFLSAKDIPIELKIMFNEIKFKIEKKFKIKNGEFYVSIYFFKNFILYNFVNLNDIFDDQYTFTKNKNNARRSYIIIRKILSLFLTQSLTSTLQNENNQIYTPFFEIIKSNFDKFWKFFMDISNFDYNINFNNQFLKKKIKFINEELIHNSLIIMKLFFKKNYETVFIQNKNNYDTVHQFEYICKSLEFI